MIPADDRLFFQHYGAFKIIGRPLKTSDYTARDLNEFKSKLNTALTKGDPVYITNIGLYEYDYDGDFSRFFIKNYSLERVGSNLYDGWHRGAIYNNIFRNTLFRVRKR
jgi:hypothetical protein